MKFIIVVLTTALCVALVSSYPHPEGDRLQSEALDRLVMVEADNETALRNKRTIGILRELFPEISQMIEQKVNTIVAEIIRVVGPTLLRNFIGNNSPGSGSSSNGGSTATAKSPFDDEDDDDDDFKSTSENGSRVSISLPTFPPDEDENTETPTSSSTTQETILETTTNSQDKTEATTVAA